MRTKDGLSFETNADFYPILREDHLPLVPSVTSSRGPTANGDSDSLRSHIVFDETGPIVRYLSEPLYSDPRLERCWALVDSNDNVKTPCHRFLFNASRIIQASSPKSERWKEWLKQRSGDYIILDLPSVPEMAAIMLVGLMLIFRVPLLTKRLYRKESGRKANSTLSLVRKWGPATRDIINSINHIAEGRDDPIEANTTGAAYELYQNLSTVTVASERAFRLTTLASKIIFLRRRPLSDVQDFTACSHFIPTANLFRIFENARRSTVDEDSLRLFQALSSHSLTRTAAGWTYELGMHGYLARNRGALEIYGEYGSSRSMSPSSRLLPGSLNGLKEADVNDSFYWMPPATNFPGVDSVLGDVITICLLSSQ